MSEHEKDPQRPSASPDAESSHPTAELPRAERGEPGSVAPQPQAAPHPVAPPPADTTGPTGPAASGDADDPWRPSHSSAPAPAPAPAPVPGPNATPNPWAGGPGHPALPHTTGMPPYGDTAGMPPYGADSAGMPPYGAGAAGMPPHGGGTPGMPPHGGAGAPPVWAQGYPAPGAPARQPRRVGRFVAAGALVLALMTGSGIAGGVIALAVDQGPGGDNRVFNAAPVIDRADLPQIADKVQDSVVSISAGDAGGSGVVLTADGYVLTNNHVVAQASGGTVKVTFANGKTADARVVGTDPKTDLAVLEASGVSDLTAATMGDSDAVRVGDTVLALGSPLGLQGSVTSGIISARDRTIQAGDGNENPFQRQQGATSISGLLQTDAPINPGNSGGALVNTSGEVIGINTAIATAGQSNGNIGVGFAIPSNKAKAVAEALRNGQKVSHPSLGVSVATAEDGGAVVNSVTPGSPAEKAGLQQGDVVTQFGGKRINESSDLVAAVQGGKVGDQVELTYSRNGAEKTATVTLAEAS
ncbi:trypsin-like peptidase domain-containing protein [Plantactinospora sp. GCM10030261]|uniref:trypsin-like peptidase domain-containing protein n=1 Tax=Plantactinospora sp. GCM10030261 TaxID=3273420 RepID=UPI00360CFF86